MEKYIVRVNGKEYEVEVEKVGSEAPAEIKTEPVKAAAKKAICTHIDNQMKTVSDTIRTKNE